MADVEEKILLRIGEAAVRLSVCRGTVYGLIRRGVLPVVNIGADKRIPADAVRELAARGTQAPHKAHV